MRFCLFLAKGGHLTAEQVLQVLDAITERTPPLGKLAVRMRMLAIKDVARLLQSEPGSSIPIGKRAIAAGLLSTSQLQVLLDAQRELTPSSAELIIEAGWMTRDEVSRLQLAFMRQP